MIQSMSLDSFIAFFIFFGAKSNISKQAGFLTSFPSCLQPWIWPFSMGLNKKHFNVNDVVPLLLCCRLQKDGGGIIDLPMAGLYPTTTVSQSITHSDWLGMRWVIAKERKKTRTQILTSYKATLHVKQKCVRLIEMMKKMADVSPLLPTGQMSWGRLGGVVRFLFIQPPTQLQAGLSCQSGCFTPFVSN